MTLACTSFFTHSEEIKTTQTFKQIMSEKKDLLVNSVWYDEVHGYYFSISNDLKVKTYLETSAGTLEIKEEDPNDQAIDIEEKIIISEQEDGVYITNILDSIDPWVFKKVDYDIKNNLVDESFFTPENTTLYYQRLLDLYKKELQIYDVHIGKDIEKSGKSWDDFKIEDNVSDPKGAFLDQVTNILKTHNDCHSLFFSKTRDQEVIHFGCDFSKSIQHKYAVPYHEIRNSFEKSSLFDLQSNSELQTKINQSTWSYGTFKTQDKSTQDTIGYMRLTSSPKFESQQDFDTFLDRQMSFFKKQTSGLVIDMRVNYGGSDKNMIALAERFADWSAHQFSYQINENSKKYFNYVTVKPFKNKIFERAPYQVFESPKEKHYNHPVVVLISNTTMSAADQFAVAMKKMAQDVTFVGSRTPSSYSDPTIRLLPNGMLYTVSQQDWIQDGHSLERDENGEQRGIYPTGVTKADIQTKGFTHKNYIPNEKIEDYYKVNSPSLKRAIEVIQEKIAQK